MGSLSSTSAYEGVGALGTISLGTQNAIVDPSNTSEPVRHDPTDMEENGLGFLGDKKVGEKVAENAARFRAKTVGWGSCPSRHHVSQIHFSAFSQSK